MTGALREEDPRFTTEEFLEWDGGGHQGKLELVHGLVRAMAPASATHSMIQGNIYFLIRSHLSRQNSPCRVLPEAPVVPKLASRSNVRAPDVVVTCAPPSQSKVLEEPIVIAEVLSPSNERETWEAILACATIPSVREFLIVDSERVQAQVFTKDAAGVWPQDPVIVEAGGTVHLHSIDASFPIAEIYAGTYLA
jgi:Uma2 family endonuclease